MERFWAHLIYCLNHSDSNGGYEYMVFLIGYFFDTLCPIFFISSRIPIIANGNKIATIALVLLFWAQIAVYYYFKTASMRKSFQSIFLGFLYRKVKALR
jgi:hypothetical protein